MSQKLLTQCLMTIFYLIFVNLLSVAHSSPGFPATCQKGLRVVADGVTSNACPVTLGVPQGSILGPLLFSVFMNSITNLPLSLNSKLALYTEDILLYKPINSTDNVSSLQEDINMIQQCTKLHRLILNYSKTCVLPITRSAKPVPLELYIGGTSIPKVTHVKYLGVIVSSNLNWSEHILNTAK